MVACDADFELQNVSTELMRDPAKAGPSLAAGFARGLFPRYLTVAQLLTLIDQSRPPPSNSIEGFAYTFEGLWRACPPAERQALLTGLAEICARPPFVSNYDRVAARQKQLARHLRGIAYEAVTTLGGAAPFDGLIKLLAVVERAGQSISLDRDGPPLDQLVRQNTAINRALFWHDVEEVRSSKQVVEGWWQVSFDRAPLWGLDAADLPWLRDDLKNKSLHDDRRVALSAIANLIRPELRAAAPELRKLIGKDFRAAQGTQLVSPAEGQPGGAPAEARAC